jgi:hypothetical protein
VKLSETSTENPTMILMDKQKEEEARTKMKYPTIIDSSVIQEFC